MSESHLLWSFFAPLLAALPRVGAAIVVAPLFPSSLFPALLRGTIALSLALHLYPHMATDMPTDLAPVLWVALIGKEACIGALLGFAAGSLIWAFESVGTILDFQAGFSNAQIFDPCGGHDAGPLSQLMLRLGTILFGAAGGLQVLTSLLFESFRLWPAASFYPSAARLVDFSGDSIRSVTELIARLAAPAVLLLALIDIGFALVSRVVPQLNVFFFTMPIKGAVCALMVALYVSFLSDIVAAQLSGLGTWLERVTAVFSAH